MNLEHQGITEQIIGAAFETHQILGFGFLEKVYQRAMQVELHKRNLQALLEPPIKVFYKGVVVGDYFADLLVEKKVIVELKTEHEYNPDHEPQLLNELKGSKIKLGLLINFGRERVDFKRMVF